MDVSKKTNFFLCSFSIIFVYDFHPHGCKMAAPSLGGVHFPGGADGKGKDISVVVVLVDVVVVKSLPFY